MRCGQTGVISRGNRRVSRNGAASRHPVLTHQRDEIALQETQLIFPGAQIGKEGPRERCITPAPGAHPGAASTAAAAPAVPRRRGCHGPRPRRGFRNLCENTSPRTINQALVPVVTRARRPGNRTLRFREAEIFLDDLLESTPSPRLN